VGDARVIFPVNKLLYTYYPFIIPFLCSCCLQVLAPALPRWSSVSSWPRGPGCCSTGPAVDTSSSMRCPWWRPSSLISSSRWQGETTLMLQSIMKQVTDVGFWRILTCVGRSVGHYLLLKACAYFLMMYKIDCTICRLLACIFKTYSMQNIITLTVFYTHCYPETI